MPCIGASSETTSHALAKSAPGLRGGVQRGGFIYSFVLVRGGGGALSTGLENSLPKPESCPHWTETVSP